MTGAVRDTRSVFEATAALARALFSGFEFQGAKRQEMDKYIQREFKFLRRTAVRHFELLKADLACWQKKVTSGELDFDTVQEDDFKDALHAFLSLSELLTEKFDEFHKRNTFLDNPRFAGLLRGYNKEAQTTLDSWQSPEWEVANERIVKWDKEQTRYLRAKYGSFQ